MDNTIISQRYAQALFDLAIEMDNLERVYTDMKLVMDVTHDNPELRKLLASPIISQGKKSQILRAIFEKHLDRLTFRFLQLMTKKERAVFLQSISEVFIELYKKHKNIVVARLKTAVPIGEDTRKQIISLLTSTTQKNIELIEVTDPALIGGFVINLDDFQYDASLRKKINRLQKSFAKNLYIKGF